MILDLAPTAKKLSVRFIIYAMKHHIPILTKLQNRQVLQALLKLLLSGLVQSSPWGLSYMLWLHCNTFTSPDFILLHTVGDSQIVVIEKLIFDFSKGDWMKVDHLIPFISPINNFYSDFRHSRACRSGRKNAGANKKITMCSYVILKKDPLHEYMRPSRHDTPSQ